MDIEESGIKIRMLKTVRPDMFLGKPGTIAREGQEYKATSNRHGAICAICDNGEKLGVKPGEFELIEAPVLLIKIGRASCRERV